MKPNLKERDLMTQPLFGRIALILVMAGFVVTTPLPAQITSDGEVLKDFSFGRIIGGRGEQNVSDFRGRVLLAVWYQDVYSGMAAAQEAVKLADKYGNKGLDVVLISNTAWKTPVGAEQRAFLHKAFKDHHTLVTPPVRVPIEFKGDAPFYFVVDTSGRLVLSGAFKLTGSKIAKTVKKALARRNKGWGENNTQKSIRKAAYVKGNIGAAWTTIGSSKEDALRKEIQELLKTRLGMISRLIDHGHFVQARGELDELAKGVAIVKPFSDSVAKVGSRLDAEQGKAGRKADARLKKLATLVSKGKATTATVKKLEKVAQSSDIKPIAARAKELALVARAML